MPGREPPALDGSQERTPGAHRGGTALITAAGLEGGVGYGELGEALVGSCLIIEEQGTPE